MITLRMLARMSEQPTLLVPEWTMGDRLRKAREAAKLSQQELAEEIGISRKSVSTYELSITPPRKPVVLAWSMRTRVPMEWLLHGTRPPTGPERPRQDSNLRRTVYNTGTRRASRKLIAA